MNLDNNMYRLEGSVMGNYCQTPSMQASEVNYIGMDRLTHFIIFFSSHNCMASDFQMFISNKLSERLFVWLVYSYADVHFTALIVMPYNFK